MRGRGVVAAAALLVAVLALSGCTANVEPGYMYVTGDPETALSVGVTICDDGWLPWASVIGPQIGDKEWLRLDYRGSRDGRGDERLAWMDVNHDAIANGSVIADVDPEQRWVSDLEPGLQSVNSVGAIVSGSPSGGFGSDFDLSELVGSDGDGWLVYGPTWDDDHSVQRIRASDAKQIMSDWCAARAAEGSLQ